MKKIKDINGIELKNNDPVYNRNTREVGKVKYNQKEDWWYFYGQDEYGETRTGVPEFLSDSPEWGVEKIKIN